MPQTEHMRLEEDARREKNWKRWGPYLSERQWGTVREDYSADGNPWTYFPHDHARSRAYRWGEDGLLGISDRECRLCFALAFWNGRDPILKERLFGLTGPEGNHGEDVKECYFYLDATPTHTYLKAQYKYPQAEFPYRWLVEENRRRDKQTPEFELADTGVFDDNRYFDILAEYAKVTPNDILMRITIANRGPEPAPLVALPTLWFRNTWAWGCRHEGCTLKPRMARASDTRVKTQHETLEPFFLEAGPGPDGAPPLFLFTENETNTRQVFGAEKISEHAKDAFHDYVIHGRADAVNPREEGTKVGALYHLDIPPGGEVTLKLRLFNQAEAPAHPLDDAFDQTFNTRLQEADAFYETLIHPKSDREERNIARQAYAGLIWSKQFYHYIVQDWMDGDPHQPPPPEHRKRGRNSDWKHLYNRDIISMPDKWEYPWYAAWDSAFHMIPFAKLDPRFAKDQLLLFLREWYMHPNGQIPAYEFALSDVNPPVHAWACWRVYKMSGQEGKRDRLFLARAFKKLLLNFTWWVNRKDIEGNHLFAGGFLGLDNIGVFDRSKALPMGGRLEQADGTAWMAFYCLTMLSMALELAMEDPAYEDMAFKFFRHFIDIVDAINALGSAGLWDETEGFYYDRLHIDGQTMPLKVRSLVGLVPLIAVEVLEKGVIDRLPEFSRRVHWFQKNRQDLARYISYLEAHEGHDHRLLAVPTRERLERVLRYLFDEGEFLSPYGIRSLSKIHQDQPYEFRANGDIHRVAYTPAESDTYLFGGNSNWRGPIWFPLNYLIIEALEQYHYFYGDTLKVAYPTGSGNAISLGDAARDIDARLARLFLPDAEGHRPCHGEDRRFVEDPHWRDLVLFYEYFHADTGRGAGASHQTGWTALVAQLLEKKNR